MPEHSRNLIALEHGAPQLVDQALELGHAPLQRLDIVMLHSHLELLFIDTIVNCRQVVRLHGGTSSFPTFDSEP